MVSTLEGIAGAQHALDSTPPDGCGSDSLRPDRRSSLRTARLLLVAAGLVVYYNSIGGAFLFDDFPGILNNYRLHELWPIGATLQGTARPLADLTLALNYALSGEVTGPYHLFNIAVHVLAGLTLFEVLRRTVAWRQAGRPIRIEDPVAVALTVSLLWVVHPLQTQSVSYVVQRCESMMGLFCLLTLYCFIRALDSGPRWTRAAVLCCAAGMACKEVMVTAPAVVLLYDRVFVAGSFRAAVRARGRVHAALWLTILIVPLLYRFNLPDAPVRSAGFGMSGPAWYQYAFLQGAVLLHYLRLSVLPAALCLDYGPQQFATFGWPLCAVAVVMFLLLLSVRALHRGHPVGFLGVCFFVILAPTSSIMPIRDAVMEHRMYLPLAAVLTGVVCAARVLLRRVPGGGPSLTRLLWMGAVCALAAVSISRNQVYASRTVMWADVVHKRPENPRAHTNLAQSLLQEGRVSQALPYFEEALRLDPTFAMALNSYGTALFELGRVVEARRCFEEALVHQPDYARAHNNLGNLLLAEERIEEAMDHLRRAIRGEPRLAEAHNNLGVALGRAGLQQEAAESYLKALEIKPEYADAHLNLGNSLLRLGRIESASEFLKTALQFDPGLIEAHYGLGLICMNQQRDGEARKHFEHVVRRQPDHGSAHHALATVLERRGHVAQAVEHYGRAVEINPADAAARRDLESARSKSARSLDATRQPAP